MHINRNILILTQVREGEWLVRAIFTIYTSEEKKKQMHEIFLNFSQQQEQK